VTKKSTAILSLMRNVFARETLPPPEGVAAPRRTGGLARLLFRAERLELTPEPPPRPGRGLLRLLFAVEPLPAAPAAAAPPRRRGRWLRWLFAPEPLDPP
jgi:hypothetical protein